VTRRASKAASSGAWLVVAILAVLTLAFALLNRPEPPIHALDVDTAFEHPERLAGRFRIEGFLVPGSCKDYQSPCEHQFQIRGRERVLNVRYPYCEMPSTGDFDPEVRVVVEGFGAVNRAEVVATTVLVMSRGPYRYQLPASGRPMTTSSEPRSPLCPGPHVPPSPAASSPTSP
jgi:hypothetical protein